MKNLLAIIQLLFMSFVSHAATDDTNSQIKEVTVYGANAFITREAKLVIPKGVHEFRIKQLSPYINEQSLQILATGDIVIHSFRVAVNYESPIASDKRVQSLMHQIQEIEKELLFKNVRIGVLNEQKDLMDKNKRLNESGLSVEELTKLVNYFNEKLTAIGNEIIELQLAMKEKEKEKLTLSNELAQLNQQEKTPSGEIVLQIEGNSEVTTTMEISYLTTNAGWMPAYDIKVPEVDSDIQLVLKASLYNNTREDWSNVKLTFSSGNPTHSGVLPTLNTWYLDLQRYAYREQQIRNKRAGKSMPAAVEMALSADESEAPSYKPVETAIVEQQTTVEYAIEQPYSLASNNQRVQVDLHTYIVPASYTYYAIPKLDKSAYLIARIENWDQPGLLDGQANLYFENRFVGKSFIDSQQLSNTFNISLGQDKSIVIQRTLVDTYFKKNMIGSDGTDRRGYKIAIRNTKSRSINLVLYDQVPVSANNEITVKLLEDGGATVNEQTGKLTWKFSIDPKTSIETTFGYEVRYPKNELVYLN